MKRNPKPPIAEERQCAGCLIWFTAESSRQSCFCSLRCQYEGKAVRYARRLMYSRGYASAEDLPDDLREAAAMKLAFARAGGYDAKARQLSPETRAAVIERDRKRCMLCGKPGKEIDHIDGSSSDMSNLRLLCSPCHMAVTWEHMVQLDLDDDDPLIARIEADEPLVPCDVDEWHVIWRSWFNAHRRPVASESGVG